MAYKIVFILMVCFVDDGDFVMQLPRILGVFSSWEKAYRYGLEQRENFAKDGIFIKFRVEKSIMH